MKQIYLIAISFFLLTQSLFAQHILTPRGYVLENDLKVGDYVIGYASGKPVINTIIEKRAMTKEFYSQQNEAFDFYLVNGKYKFFSGQSIYANRNIVHAFELRIGDTLYNGQNHRILVKTIARKQEEQKWFRLIISGNHSYIKDRILLHNASRFWVGGGASANWSATGNTNWSATSGGTNNASVPTSSDDVTFDGAGTNGNTNSTISAAITVLSLNITSAYTATMNHNGTLTIAGNVTFGANYTIAGASGLILSATCSVTSNGKVWPNALQLTGNSTTKTLSGNWSVGSLTVGANNAVINATTSETLTINGNILMSGALSAGTAKIIWTSGTWSGVSNATIANDLDIQGTVTISGNVYFITKTLHYVSGTVTKTGSTLNLTGSCTMNTNGMDWNNVSLTATATYTLNSLLTVDGTLTFAAGTTTTLAGSGGFTTSTLTDAATSALNRTFAHGVTYTITTALNAATGVTTTSRSAFLSDDGTLKAIITLQYGASCNTQFNFTRIDASGGRTINTFNGSVTGCINVNSFTDLKTTSGMFAQ